MKNVLVAIGVFAVVLATVSVGVCGAPGLSTDRAVLKAVVHSAALGLGAVAVSKDNTYNTEVIRRIRHLHALRDGIGGQFVTGHGQ